MVQSSEQPWAAQFPESSSKIPASTREGRLSWLDAAGKPVLKEMGEAAAAAGMPEAVADKDLETGYQQEGCLLDLEQAFLEPDEERQTAALGKHPKDRSLEEHYLAELAMLPSQAEKATAPKNPEHAGKLPRAEMAEQWRKDLGRKAPSARLALLQPVASKSKADKPAAKKKQKKNYCCKFSLRPAAWKLRRRQKQKEQQKQKQKEAESGPMAGKKFRVVGQSQSRLFQNRDGTCERHWEAEEEVLLSFPASQGKKQQLRLPVSDVWELPQTEEGPQTLPLTEDLPDLRRCTEADRAAACAAAGNELQQLLPNTMMQGPELTAIWHLLLWRARLSATVWPAAAAKQAGCCLLNPEAGRTAAAQQQQQQQRQQQHNNYQQHNTSSTATAAAQYLIDELVN